MPDPTPEPCWECKTPTTRRHENPSLSFPLCDACADLAPQADAWIAAIDMLRGLDDARPAAMGVGRE